MLKLSYKCQKCGAENRNVVLSEFGLHFNFISNNKYDYEEVHTCSNCGVENRFRITGEANNSESLLMFFSSQEELNSVKTRLNKLKSFMKSKDFDKLENETRESLFWQKKYMEDCIELLENHLERCQE